MFAQNQIFSIFDFDWFFEAWKIGGNLVIKTFSVTLIGYSPETNKIFPNATS